MPGHKDKGLGTATQRTLPIGAAADTSGAGGTLLIKTSKHLSQMNHRLYRQLRNYEVSLQFNPPNAEDSTMTYYVWSLPDTWFVRNSIKYAYQTYMQSHRDEVEAGIQFSRWHDFTIDEQDPDGTWEQSQALLYDGNAHAGLSSDESPPDSLITLNDGSTTRGFCLFANPSSHFNIFEEYAKRYNYRVPDDESVSSDQPYEGVLDLKDADKMAEVGDRAPYDRDFSNFLDDGTDDQNVLVLQDVIHLDKNGGQGRTSTRRFTAPLGLVFVEKWDESGKVDVLNTWPEVLLRCTPGSYKGVKAPSLV